MAYVNDEKDPELIFKVDHPTEMSELYNIEKMVDNMNQQLIDSGFDQYQYRLDFNNQRAYIRLDAS